MDRMLQDQCSALWRLDIQGRWRCLYRMPAPGIEEVEGFMEFFAAMCRPKLGPGAEVTAKLGDWMVLAVVDEKGILIGARDKPGNPIAIRTAMEIIESKQLSTRSTTSHILSQHNPDPPPAPAHQAQEDDMIAFHIEAIDDPPSREIASAVPSSGFAWNVRETSPGDIDIARMVTPAPVRPEPRYEEPDTGALEEDFSFDIVFQEDSNVFEELEAKPAGLEDITVPAPDCTWGEVAVYLDELTKLMGKEIGRRVATKYWSDVIEENPALQGQILVDKARAKLSAHTELAAPDAEQREALVEITAQWRERCALVVPDVSRVLDAARRAPWL